MSDTIIRDGSGDDIAGVMRVMNAAFDPAHGEAWSAPQCAGALAIPGTYLLIAQRERRIAGFALYRALLDEGELLLIAIDPAIQRTGLGSALLDAAIAGARDKGISRFHLEMRANNPAHRFYLRREFENVGVRRNYYRGRDGQLTDAVTMSRALA